MTFTTQVQPVGACTTNVCAPRVDCEVTDCPDAPVSLIAGVPVADDPAGVTDTWKDGPEAGAGAQLKSQPMFQPAAVVVKEGLVQLPDICVGPRSTRAGPAAAADEAAVDPLAAVVVDPLAAVVVDPPAVVVVERPAPLVVLDPPALDPPALSGAVVVETVPDEVGSLYAGAPVDEDVVEPSVVPLSQKPRSNARPAATTSCHVAQLLLPLIWSSPGAGMTSSRRTGPPGPGAAPMPLPGGGGDDIAKPWPGFRSPSRQRGPGTAIGRKPDMRLEPRCHVGEQRENFHRSRAAVQP